jgi:hypothetical protein
MAGINLKRVLLGGLAVGLVLNVSESILNMVVLAEANEAVLKNLNLPPISGGAIGFYVAWGFVQGVVTVWLYAAMRPRLGAGPRTALVAGLLVWLLAYVVPQLGNAFTHLAPWSLTLTYLAWVLVEAPLVALLGAWLYREA